MGCMMASASSSVALTVGEKAASSRPMLMYWLPWPGKRKASLPGWGPRPRKMPCASIAFHACGVSSPMTLRAFCSRSTSSAWSPKSMTSRSLARMSTALGSSKGGVQPASTRFHTSSTRFFRSLGVLAPRARMPRGGAGGEWRVASSEMTAPSPQPSPTGRGSMLPCSPAPRPTATPANCFGRRASIPGTCSSITRWKLVPPKP